MSSITNIWFPEDRREELRKAARHYHFESLAAYFRICGEVLCEHARKKDQLIMPMQFCIEPRKQAK